MKGTRPLDNDEIRRVSTSFTGTYQVRNCGLFMIGVSTGGRISELLYEKNIVKGGEVLRAVSVNRDGRTAIEGLIAWHRERYNTKADRPLFPSRHKSGQSRCTSEITSLL